MKIFQITSQINLQLTWICKKSYSFAENSTNSMPSTINMLPYFLLIKGLQKIAHILMKSYLNINIHTTHHSAPQLHHAPFTLWTCNHNLSLPNIYISEGISPTQIAISFNQMHFKAHALALKCHWLELIWKLFAALTKNM